MRADDDVGARLVGEFLDDGPDLTTRPHLGESSRSRHIRSLDLKSCRKPWNVTVNKRAYGQGDAHVETTIGGRLIAAPGYGGGREPSACKLSLAQPTNELA